MANVAQLGLDAAGVRVNRQGIEVNDHLRTANPSIYAAGDVCSSYRFTHAADAMARIVIQNALFFGSKRVSKLVIPWATYTHPEVAHVGMTHTTAESQKDVQPFLVPISETDRGRCDGEIGCAKVSALRDGTLLGATVVADHAGELLAEVTLAITHGLSLKAIAETIHPYPTQSEVIAKVAAAWNRTRLTTRAAWFLRTLLSWRRGSAAL